MTTNKLEKIKIDSIDPVDHEKELKPLDEELFKNMSTNFNIYTVKFRKKAGAVVELHFKDENDEKAGISGRKFCNKHNFIFVYVKPFLTDLNEWKSL